MAQVAEEKKEVETPKDQFELNANQITERIWLGSEDAAHAALDVLCEKHNIKYILVAGFGLTALHEKDENSSIIYKKMKCIDISGYEITKDVITGIKFIEQCLGGEEEGNLLIHCASGKSRSASITIGYLMWKHDISFAEAKYRVKQKRNVISPNAGFEKQLQEFEKTKKDVVIE